MDVPYLLKGCRKCPYTDKSRPYMQYGRLRTYYWYISKTSHIPEFPINRKREIQYVLSVLSDRRCKITTNFWNMQIKVDFSVKNIE